MTWDNAGVLKLVLDQGVPADAAPLFRQLGYECQHVSEVGMSRADDEEILSFAAERGFAVITLDADFHALLAVNRWRGTSVLRLRREGCRAEAVVEIVEPVLTRYRAELARGAMVSIKEGRVTCHLLPIGEGQ